MAEHIGARPSFDPNSPGQRIKRRFARTWAQAVFYSAAREKNPADYVKKSIAKIEALDPKSIEKKYRREGAIKETKEALGALAADFSAADRYWKKVFEHVTKKYFKNRESEIRAALERSRWYPYLEVLEEKSRDRIIMYMMPTDHLHKERYLKFKAKERLDYGWGWMHLKGNFLPKNGADCFCIESIKRVKIQSVKMRGKPGDADGSGLQSLSVPELPKPAIDLLCDNAYDGEKISLLREQINDLLLLINLYNSEGYLNVDDMFMCYQNAVHMLDKDFGDFSMSDAGKIIKLGKISAALKEWKTRFVKAIEETGVPAGSMAHYGPKPLYPLDFLPAFLASLHSLEKNHGKELKASEAVTLDTRVPEAMTFVFGSTQTKVKASEDYKRLINILGAEKIGEHSYLAKFSR